MAETCDKRLYSYDHWACTETRGHPGRHRFNNYTRARFPHFWRVRSLWIFWKGNRRLAALDTTKARHSYRKVLFPDTYDPLPRPSHPGGASS